MAAGSQSEDAKGQKSLVVRGILCLLCTLVGAFYPTMVDWSKTALQRELVVTEHSRLEVREVRTYPFSPVSVVLVDDALQVSIGMVFVASKMRLRSLCSYWGLVLKMIPLGVIYAVGELLTLHSVQKASGPAYVVVANMKLVVAALMSRAFFGRCVAMPWGRWLELILISLAAATYTVLEAGSLGTQWNWEGVWTALVKSSLVAFTSVFCEHTYKSNPFYLTLTLQAFWGLVCIALLVALSMTGLAAPSIASELTDGQGAFTLFASGSSYPLCDSSVHVSCEKWATSLEELPQVGQTLCQCVTQHGWDRYTILTVFADLSNAISSALVFRQLSAVAKYVCRATSAVPMYIFYCSMGRTVFSLQMFAVIAFLCLVVSWYTLQQHHRTSARRTSDAAWVKQYGGLSQPQSKQGL